MLIHPIEVLCDNTTILNTLVHQLVACFVLVYAFGCYEPVQGCVYHQLCARYVSVRCVLEGVQLRMG